MVMFDVLGIRSEAISCKVPRLIFVGARVRADAIQEHGRLAIDRNARTRGSFTDRPQDQIGGAAAGRAVTERRGRKRCIAGDRDTLKRRTVGSAAFLLTPNIWPSPIVSLPEGIGIRRRGSADQAD